MRDIKFRGKRVDNGKWVYGQLIKEISENKMYTYILINPYNYESYGCIEADEIIEVIPETVGQYAELQDKNKKEIYKGDIVENENCVAGIVCYENGCYWVKWENDLDLCLLYWCNDNLEVIGNIYDNPELLEKQK